MNKFLGALALMMCVVSTAFGVVEFESIYPPSVQYLITTDFFRGDSQGAFVGNPVAILSDGSAWKIHPEDAEKYSHWSVNDRLRVRYRTEFYWFKREHKFWLYNHNNGESCRVMIAQHSNYPFRRIESTELLSREEYVEKVTYIDGTKYKKGSWEQVPYAKILRLSDGSIWRIKNQKKFDQFPMGASVFVGVQGTPGIEYDFILIVGLEREAISTRARLQH